MRTFVAEFFYSVWLMREFIIADNQDISKAGMMCLLSHQKEVSLLLEADNKAELIQQLRLYPQAVIILDYTLFNVRLLLLKFGLILTEAVLFPLLILINT